MTDERPNSLAAQAASWVPPWERAPREPDRAYQEAATEPDISDETDEPDTAGEPVAVDDSAAGDEPAGDEPDGDEPAGDELDAVGEPDAGEQPREADLRPDDDVDAESEGMSPPPLPGETTAPVTVDEPAELPEDSDGPTDVGLGPELPVPASIEQATEGADEDEAGALVDAPVPPDGDDAGEIFDQAADDDVSDEADVDLPFAEDVPGDEEPARGDAGPDATGTGDSGGSRPGAGESGTGQAEFGKSGAGEAEAGESDAGEAEAGESDAAEAEAGEQGAAVGDAAEAAVAGAAGASIPAQSVGRRAAPAAVGAPETRTDDEVDLEKPQLDDAELRAALEAILLVVDEPVAEMQLAQILEHPTERVAAMLEDISARYTAAGHGFDLRRAAGGWRLYTRPEYAVYVERFVLDGQSVRLTQAALETLAVVAYKQPVTRSRISAIRGVNCDGVMRTLATRGLIEECGTEPETGAHLYRTTALFLEKLGLNSVDQLPPLAPFLPDDVEEVLDASG